NEPVESPGPAEGGEPIPSVVVPRKVGHPLLAWLVIIPLLAAAVWLQRPPPPPEEAALNDPLAVLLLEMQARYAVGAADLFGSLEGKRSFYAQVAKLNTGSVAQRLRFVVLAGELAGPMEALERLRELDRKLVEHGITPTPEQTQIKDALGRLYR